MFVEYEKKITDKSELFDANGELKYQCLYHYDISDVDLSDVDPSVWENASFFHTNFKNTGIKFYPTKLQEEYFPIFHERSLEQCNFENCDFSHLTDEDFKNVNFSGANFRNTNLQVDFRNNKVFSLCPNQWGFAGRQEGAQYVNLKEGTILPEFYENKPIDYFDYADLDIQFLENNPNIKISSGKLVEVISAYFSNKYKYSHEDEVTKEEFKEYYQQFLNFLEYDYEGKLKRLYEDIKSYLVSQEQYLKFFKGVIWNICFDELDLTYLDKKMLTAILFEQCDFNKLSLSISYKELNKETARKWYLCFMKSSPINELILPTSIHDWQNAGRKRLHDSKITMQTNLYLEFERVCNMHCEFCRNEAFKEVCPFDFFQVMKTLKRIYNHLNNIVIGGGEPTIHLDELHQLSQIIRSMKAVRKPKLYIITNCSLDREAYSSLNSLDHYHFYFSRLAVEDSENKRIFKDKNNKIMTTEDLMHFHDQSHIMCCTCFKGGVDDVSKILEYVRYVKYIGYKNVLFQNLHLEDEYNIPINISERVMMEAIEKLREQGFLVKQPIYSNSNYVLYILRKDDFRISFKIYKQPEIILEAWNKSPKRCFDLSIDPSGNLHETWKEPDNKTILQKKIG